jgi:quercetin dioxygenase-like cupin family protein
LNSERQEQTRLVDRNYIGEEVGSMAVRHAEAGEIVDLRGLGPGLNHARTTALTKTELFEVVRLIVRAGADIKTHAVNGPITLHCLEGRALLGLPAATIELSAGQWIFLEGGEPHSVKGVEDSSLLLTIIFPSGSEKRNSENTAKARRQVADHPAEPDSASLLEEGLEGTFPASDPVSISNPSIGVRIKSRPKKD